MKGDPEDQKRRGRLEETQRTGRDLATGDSPQQQSSETKPEPELHTVLLPVVQTAAPPSGH